MVTHLACKLSWLSDASIHSMKVVDSIDTDYAHAGVDLFSSLIGGCLPVKAVLQLFFSLHVLLGLLHVKLV